MHIHSFNWHTHRVNTDINYARTLKGEVVLEKIVHLEFGLERGTKNQHDEGWWVICRKLMRLDRQKTSFHVLVLVGLKWCQKMEQLWGSINGREFREVLRTGTRNSGISQSGQFLGFMIKDCQPPKRANDGCYMLIIGVRCWEDLYRICRYNEQQYTGSFGDCQEDSWEYHPKQNNNSQSLRMYQGRQGLMD